MSFETMPNRAAGASLPVTSRVYWPEGVGENKVAALEIGHPWARATPPSAPAGGGFLVITNTGSTPDRLVSVRSPAALATA